MLRKGMVLVEKENKNKEMIVTQVYQDGAQIMVKLGNELYEVEWPIATVMTLYDIKPDIEILD